jgi:hypothetical protein
VDTPSKAGISWPQGTRQAIYWSQTGYLPTDLVKVTLWNGSPLATKYTIADNVKATDETVSWEIPYSGTSTIATGNYKVKVESKANSAISDLSDNNFAITLKPSSTTGGVRISSTPTGARIYWDGVDSGLTTASPYTQISDKIAGTHTIGLKLNNYYDYSGNIEVRAGLSDTAYPFTLMAKELDQNGLDIDKDPKGGLIVESIPAGATVWIGETGTTPTATYGQTRAEVLLKPGLYDVYVTKAGYQQSDIRTVRVETQTPTRVPESVVFTLTENSNWYTFTGFDAPVDMGGIINTAKAGSNIPVKWHLSDGNGYVSTQTFSLKIDTLASCPASTNDDIEVLDSTSPVSILTYQGNGAWHYNWKTEKGITGCKKVYLQFDNGLTSPAAIFKLR